MASKKQILDLMPVYVKPFHKLWFMTDKNSQKKKKGLVIIRPVSYYNLLYS